MSDTYINMSDTYINMSNTYINKYVNKVIEEIGEQLKDLKKEVDGYATSLLANIEDERKLGDAMKQLGDVLSSDPFDDNSAVLGLLMFIFN